MKPPVAQRAEATGWGTQEAHEGETNGHTNGDGAALRFPPFLRPLRKVAAPEDSRQLPDTEAGAGTLWRDAAYKRTLAVADAIAATLALAVGIVGLGQGDQLTAYALLLLPLAIVVGKTVGLYDRDEHVLRKTTLDEAPELFQVATLYTLLFWLGGDLFVTGELGRSQVLGLWGILFLAMIVLRSASRTTVQRLTSPERCVVVGDRQSAEWLHCKFNASHDVHGTILGHVPLHGKARGTADLPVIGRLDDIGLTLARQDIDRVIIAPGNSHPDADELLHAIRLVKALGVKVTVLPRLFEVVGSAVEFDDVDGVPLLGVRRHGLSQSSRFLKRATDLVLASIALFLLAPLLAVLAIAIKLDSPGPAFFRQRRIGARDEEFEIIKFRTMVDGADSKKDDLREQNEAEGGLFKITDDPRCTRVGKILRRTSLDELPQLFNVLRGEMSLVGPRPLVPDEDKRVEGLHRRRLIVKPGMTGLWQIFGSARIPLDEMVKIDYLYGANWSLWLDVKVLLRTVPFVVARRGI